MEPPLPEKPRQIHEALRQLRLSRGMTQAEVAPALGVSRSTVAQIEGGNRSLKALEVGRLAALYGCSAEELLAPLEKEASALAARTPSGASSSSTYRIGPSPSASRRRSSSDPRCPG